MLVSCVLAISRFLGEKNIVVMEKILILLVFLFCGIQCVGIQNYFIVSLV